MKNYVSLFESKEEYKTEVRTQVSIIGSDDKCQIEIIDEYSS